MQAKYQQDIAMIEQQTKRAIEDLKKERQPVLDMMSKQIIKYKQALEELKKRKEEMDQELSSEICVAEGEEEKLIKD